MSAPVRYTCPDIDKVIKSITSAQREAKHGERINNESSEIFSEILYELDGLIDIVEGMRKSNAELREWGNNLERDLTEFETQQQ